MISSVVVAFSCIKLLLYPSYRSTDFEVHRNWLAITNSLPLNEWYKNDTSEWTLDYPPLFAWFEWLLSQIAFYFDPKMLEVSNLNYASEMTILFQRTSVIITDLVFACAVKECVVEVGKTFGTKRANVNALFLIALGNAGLLLVDHIHFQYNGFLFGVMLLSIARILQGREIEGAFWFAVLLNLKHIYLYIAPAYFVYLLRSYCFSSNSNKSIRWLSLSLSRLVKLGLVVVGVFALSFGPFVFIGQLNQVLLRLFPFKRGLSHAYWAPNFWTLYNFADKVLATVGSRYGFLNITEQGSMTSGLVQEYQHAFLPTITPFITFVITLFFMMPILCNVWRTPHDPWQFVRGTIMCGYCSYLFGWHVHEKAILLVILPLTLLCFSRKSEARFFILLSIVGHFSLFPLIFTNHETVIKVTALLLHAVVTCSTLKIFWNVENKKCFLPLLSSIESLYLYGLIPLFLYEQVLHQWFDINGKLPFLPLMMISVYCSIGVIYSWFRLYHLMLFGSSKLKKKVK